MQNEIINSSPVPWLDTRPSWNKWQQFLTFRYSNIENQKNINLICIYFQKNQKVKKQ